MGSGPELSAGSQPVCERSSVILKNGCSAARQWAEASGESLDTEWTALDGAGGQQIHGWAGAAVAGAWRRCALGRGRVPGIAGISKVSFCAKSNTTRRLLTCPSLPTKKQSAGLHSVSYGHETLLPTHPPQAGLD